MRDMQLKLTTTVQRRRHMETTTIYLYVQLSKKKTKQNATKLTKYGSKFRSVRFKRN